MQISAKLGYMRKSENYVKIKELTWNIENYKKISHLNSVGINKYQPGQCCKPFVFIVDRRLWMLGLRSI